jgi:hypothetical protein
MRRISVKLILLLATVAALPCWAQPTITSLAPASVPAGSSAITLTISGTNFVLTQGVGAQSTVSLNGAAVATTFVNGSTLAISMSASLLLLPAEYSVVVTNPGYPAEGPQASNAVTFSVLAPVISSLSVTSVPAGSPACTLTVTGANFLPGSQVSFRGTTLAATFLDSYTLTTTLPASLLATAGQVSVQVINPGGAASGTVPFVVSASVVTIASTASSVPSGVVGVAYTGLIAATGGTPPYSFAVTGGSLPDGLALAPGGTISGTPKTAGQFAFSVGVTDAKGGSAASGFVITIQPAPLNITGGPAGPVVAGTPVNITFAASGGVGPYQLTNNGNLPPGTTFNNGVLSGTPTTVGAFTFLVTVTDSTKAVYSNYFTLTVTAAPPLSLGGTLSGGKVGVAYTGQITATGGTGPYSYAGTGLPGGLSLAATGAISGTPTTAGQFTLSATVTDAKGATAGNRYGITIAPADLSITTASLPDGVVGVAYTVALSASGGVPPYTWTVTGLPGGVTATAAGAISGTPAAAGKFTVSASVKDSAGSVVTKSYSPTIAPAPLVITTASAPNGTVGTAYSTSFAASGGTAPYTFSASGLPAGLSMSAAATISGTPTAPGAATIVVTVKDAASVSTSKSFAVTITLPPAPPLSFSIAGVSDTASPLQQPRVQVTLGSGYPVAVAVTLTLSFAPDSGADDPTIQFSSGGRTASITVPAGATAGATDVGVQTGTVAGVITITAHLQASGQDVTPTPVPSRTIRVAALAPVIVAGTLTAVRNSTGFTVTLTGYATDRELTQANYVFAAAAGSNLQTTTLTVPLTALFAGYYGGSSATPYGSQFTYTQPFTVTGISQAIVSVTVTLVNNIGQSSAVTATLN